MVTLDVAIAVSLRKVHREIGYFGFQGGCRVVFATLWHLLGTGVGNLVEDVYIVYVS